MVVPVVIWIGIGLASFLMGSSIALKWDDIIVALKGKRLAVLGARAVGKTHLTRFLTSGTIPEEYQQTVAPNKVSGRRLQIKDLDLKFKGNLDVSGSKDAYAVWKEQFDHSDIVFYLLRADRLINGDADVEARVRDDLRHIGGWLETRKPRPIFFIIGTHCDLDDEFAGLTPDKLGDYTDKFRRIPVVTELVARGGGSQRAKVVLGSMKTLPATEALVYQIFMQVM